MRGCWCYIVTAGPGPRLVRGMVVAGAGLVTSETGGSPGGTEAGHNTVSAANIM